MSTSDDKGRELHGLVRPATIRWLWRLFGGVLGITVAAGLWLEPRGHFGIDGSFGFHAGFGFLACAAMVVAVKLLGLFIRRPENYYKSDDV